MGLSQEIGVAVVAGLVASIAAAAQAAQCSRSEFDPIHARPKACASGQVKVACDGEYPDVAAGIPLCCPLAPRRRAIWFCDGERNRFNCPAGSVFVEATATDRGVRLTCFAPKPEPPPVDEEAATETQAPPEN